MRLKNVTAVFFSPTGNAKKIVTAIAEVIADKAGLPVKTIDITLPQARNDDGTKGDKPLYVFGPGELVVFGTPVYAGRIPNKILPAFQTLFAGNGALAVPVVTFGNRSFDNGLIEMRMELEQHGFHTIAGAAFVSEHVFSDKLAAGRPNEDDMAVIRQFASDAAGKAEALAEGPCDGMAEIPAPIQVKGEDPIPGYYRPLGADGKPAVFLKAKPKTSDACNDCGICAKVCPMGSISSEDFRTVTGVCIKCHACVRLCPENAKYFDDPALLSHIRNLEDNYTRRAENAVFL
ncbi:MAG: 4Fe-4S binding protein [Eubacteriales bacterium]|nr:4Fe-4S binding protein [Eubacteriales bacterium]